MSINLSRRLVAVVASAALLATAAPLPGERPAAAYASSGYESGSGSGYDLDRAADVRAAQCLLAVVQRKGGQALKSVARSGLKGTEEELLQAADPEYWSTPGTRLHLASTMDHNWLRAKADELAGRNEVWEESLALSPPDGYSYAAFHTIESKDDPFVKVGLFGWINTMFWQAEDELYADRTPVAGQDSVEAATKIAAERYPEGSDWNARNAWEGMTFMHPMYADDARLFLEHGGFPTSAPDPDSTEFRIDVENLKARFASCTSHNPPDPFKVLTTELVTASTEWQAEIDGQRAQRESILAEEAEANADLQIATQALGEALGQSIIASRLADWQAYWLKQTPDTPSYPDAAEFPRVRNDIVKAQGLALGRVFVASRAAQSAQQHATKAVAAQQAAYQIADAAHLPRGRGLLYGQQAVQVTRASAAATLAVAKATETAANATRASATDSKTLMALAETQAHASQAEFRRVAAQEAAAQAKAAAEGAAEQAAQAAVNATKAKDAQARAEAAEQAAKDAAADARAKREIAETERENARTQKEIAARQQAVAAEADARAQSERQRAATQLSAAQSAGATAAERKQAALEAERTAAAARNDALQAESERDALLVKAEAHEAHAASVEGTDAAAAARTAATQARAAANRATTAAANARAAANDATAAATAAREAATRAEAAASRAKAASDAAQRDVAITNAAVKSAHAAAADAIDASEAAAENVRLARIYADTAKAKAAKAKADATVARQEADAAGAAAVRTAGFAYSTAQAARAARDSAAQVIKPANDAIELGSPYQETDASAGLAVLTGQASKTVAAQQAAVAKAKAAQAARAAKEAAALAAKADADAKVAATAAADAADWAAKAADSLAETQASAAQAASAAKAAVRAEAATVAYDRQATADAAAAASAADAADGYAGEARDSATEAERDAASARQAATAAEDDAAKARDVATQAEKDADTAENAAAHARELAEEAQRAAERAEAEADRQREAERASEAGPTGIPGLIGFAWEPSLDMDPQGNCTGTGSGCHIDMEYHLYGTQDYYLLSCPQAGKEIADCTAPLVGDYVGSGPFDLRFTKRTYIDGGELTQSVWASLTKALVHDYVGCWRKVTGSGGSLGNCAWAFGDIVVPPMIKAGYRYARAVRVGIRDGGNLAEAVFQLRNYSGLPATAVTRLEVAAGRAMAAGQCFPAGTLVDTEHGARPIEQIRVGDRVWSADPATGRRGLHRVTRLFHRSADSLVNITAAGGTLSATEGHRFWVQGQGWTQAKDLRPGDALQEPSGKAARVVAVSPGGRGADVYNFEVEADHTYYVYAGSTPVLVHNDCLPKIQRGTHVVLGMDPYITALTKEVRKRDPAAINFLGDAFAKEGVSERPLWMDFVDNSVSTPGVKVSVTLDGVMDETGAIVADPTRAFAIQVARAEKVPAGDWRTIADRKNNLGTAWEMRRLRTSYIMGNKEWEDIDFYMTRNGAFVKVEVDRPAR
ncbi:secreted protein [[Actinomadura] parvosata subsp. kistnae]|uniref:polymorphic toxin-type HINT domain-containing protein n=1 Tax=[Actinomadura] parvosata TaxID=1955412 RepID=UPI000D2C0CA6|nr:secreted protein [Actinomadura parvosata subsp. kistnae]